MYYSVCLPKGLLAKKKHEKQTKVSKEILYVCI